MAISDERREVLESVAKRFAGDFGVESSRHSYGYIETLDLLGRAPAMPESHGKGIEGCDQEFDLLTTLLEECDCWEGNAQSYSSLLDTAVRSLVQDAVACLLERDTEGQPIRLVEAFDGGGLRAVRAEG